MLIIFFLLRHSNRKVNALIITKMKNIIVTLFALMISFQASGQRKSKVDPKDAQIDSLKIQVDSLSKVSKNLSLQLDSVSTELVKYVGVYNTIKEKVLHYSFDPTRSAYLIDSLAASRDSTAAILALNQKPPVPLSDTVNAAPVLMSASVLPPVPEAELERARAVSALKQLKEFLQITG